ncbi:ABC transporter ATP-binding protein [Vannielia litorea]|uniref:Oligopeptide transport system ATP-binding protein n=1 Tax=Vannielia litorea TaxID=1217970 RepID=A0A1N6GUY5_9RHOB|nr:ABC transporter ATP-binding protein [Vannielia litorea]SIO11343.1 oligopeptide transport system ATP-binding protein [Vannielia litorea]
MTEPGNTPERRAPAGDLLDIRDLRVEFRLGTRVVHAVNGVSLTVKRGETLVVLGESGSGKSITFEAVTGILDTPPGHVTGGSARFDNQNLFELSDRARRKICGRHIGIVMQDPLSALNPVYTVGFQLAEMSRVHMGMSKASANARALEMLRKVGIPDAESRFNSYPHEFSGGMRQRLLIAMAIAVNPELIIADEPTTALDVTVEAQILALLRDLREQTGVGLVIITHSMGVAAEVADRVCVMYAGKVVETADVRSIFGNAAHPYTQGLLNSIPHQMSGQRLTPIPGQPPDLANLPAGCPFHPRCGFARDQCRTEAPALRAFGKAEHQVACHFAETVAALPGATSKAGHGQ